ncbi:alpha/beta fold hydrolase [Nonomuraea sp. B1E8]|uniref:alpha/beta fold hydrolase n=1 Tax=unclassified Nonomuraea TaxID=2593643 RepID=UPI00325CF6F4
MGQRMLRMTTALAVAGAGGVLTAPAPVGAGPERVAPEVHGTGPMPVVSGAPEAGSVSGVREVSGARVAAEARGGGAAQRQAGGTRRRLAWWDCGDGLRCAKLSVPADWARPGGARTEIDVARLPARDPRRSRGHLVVNTGAGSSIQDVRARPDTVSELARWFDVVIMEARGSGDHDSAAAVRCAVPPPDVLRLQLSRGPAGWRAHARANAAYGRSCRAAAGATRLTSWQVARDLDALRAALGEARLRYFGNSYGAVYGQAYAESFPGRVGRMYLEGVPDLVEPGLERRMTARARAVERQLYAFRDWCRGRLGCPLGEDDAVSVFDHLAGRVPLPAGPRSEVNARRLVAAVYAGLTPARWPELARALSAAGSGDARPLASLASASPGSPFLTSPSPASPASPASPGSPAPAGADDAPRLPSTNGTTLRMMMCQDFVSAMPRYQGFLGMEKRLRAVAPRVGWMSGRHEAGRCLGLAGTGPSQPSRPSSAVSQPSRLSSLSAGTRVLVGIGRLDIEAPASGAARAARRIPGAVVLWHGDGHDAYLLQGVRKLRATCLRARVHDYFVKGTLPARGTACRGALVDGMDPRGATAG